MNTRRYIALVVILVAPLASAYSGETARFPTADFIGKTWMVDEYHRGVFIEVVTLEFGEDFSLRLTGSSNPDVVYDCVFQFSRWDQDTDAIQIRHVINGEVKLPRYIIHFNDDGELVVIAGYEAEMKNLRPAD